MSDALDRLAEMVEAMHPDRQSTDPEDSRRWWSRSDDENTAARLVQLAPELIAVARAVAVIGGLPGQSATMSPTCDEACAIHEALDALDAKLAEVLGTDDRGES